MEDPGIDGRIILRWIFRKLNGVMDWIVMAVHRDRWLTLVNAVMNLWVARNAGNFLTSRELVIFLRQTLFPGVSK